MSRCTTEVSRLVFGLICAFSATTSFAARPLPPDCSSAISPPAATAPSPFVFVSRSDEYGYGGSLCNAYITNYSDNTVSVIDPTSNWVVATIPVGSGPDGVAVSRDGRRVYVANYLSGDVSVIDVETLSEIETIAVGTMPYGIATSPDGKWVYVNAYYANKISIIDTATNTVVGTIPTGQRPRGMVVNWDSTRIYVANYADNNISVIDAVARRVLTKIALPAKSNPMGMTISEDGARLYVTGYTSNKLYEINTATNAVAATISVGSRPTGVALSPNQQKAYVTNYSGNLPTSVSAIDLASGRTVTPIPLPAGVYPAGVTANPAGEMVYVVSFSTAGVYLLDANANSVTDVISVGTRPHATGSFMVPPQPSAWDFTPPTLTSYFPSGVVVPVSPAPTIGIDYSNPSTGIDTTSIGLVMDGIGIPSAWATITPTRLTYTPASITWGSHVVSVTVPDKYGLMASQAWIFYASAGPLISGKQPVDGTVFPPGPLPQLSASFIDQGAWVDPSTVRLFVDGVDVTGLSMIGSSEITYTPTTMVAGSHTARLTLANPAGMTADATWTFTTNTGIHAAVVAPLLGQRVTDPLAFVTAEFGDIGASIVPARTQLVIDGIDVTARAQMVADGLNYVPEIPWTPGAHSIALTVFDDQGNSANATSSFSFDAPPSVYDETPKNAYVAVPNPNIRALIQDGGSGIDAAATRITLDGVDMSAAAIITTTEVRLATSGLGDGIRTVRIDTRSLSGQVASKEWQFTVISIPAPATTTDGVRTPRTFVPRVGVLP